MHGELLEGQPRHDQQRRPRRGKASVSGRVLGPSSALPASSEGGSPTSHTITKTDNTHKEVHRWSAEKMDQELGAAKAKATRESGKIAWQRCSITGSKEAHMIEWLVSVNWKETVSGDGRETSFDTTTEGCADDDTILGNIDGSPEVKVKEEQTSAMELLAEEVDEFKKKASLEAKLKEFQQMEVEAKLFQTKAATTKSTSHIAAWKEDLKKHIAQLPKVVKILVRLCAEEPVEDKELPDLLAKLKALREAHSSLKEWAERFGCIDARPRKRITSER